MREITYCSKRVLVDNRLQEAAIVIGKDGRITKVLQADQLTCTPIPSDIEVVDVGNLVIMPGLVDSHVHVNEPGRVAWEGFKTVTMAAAAGGITTLVDMPLNSIPPTTSRDNLKIKLSSADGQIFVDVAFWGGVIPKNEGELKGLLKAGVVGFKCFLCPSGVDEFPGVTITDANKALKELQGTNSVLAFHAECELKNPVADNGGDVTAYQTYLQSRPPEMEVEAILKVAEMCDKYRVRCHIVHLSAAEGLPIIRASKAAGSPLTVETCHHYLTLTSETIPDGATQYKCCPPIRSEQNREKLWAALAAGDIDMVVSDHSPSTADLKHFEDGNFMEAWGGIASVQFGLSLFWTQAKERGFSLCDVARLLSYNPARLCGLHNCKGKLKEGMDGDLVIWDPEASFEVEDSIIQFKNKMTPYLGMQLFGKVKHTVVRGCTVFHEGVPFPPPQGRIICNEL